MNAAAYRPTRRSFLESLGVAAVSLPVATLAEDKQPKKTHILTLSFDDGFRKSSIRTAEIYEKYGVKACFNIIASAHLPTFKPADEYQAASPIGDFDLWNRLKARGHEIMPHGYRHANLRALPHKEATDLILRSLDIFDKELKEFDRKKAVFNFPFNASSPDLDAWLPKHVRAFRAGGGAVNPWPHKGQVKLTTGGARGEGTTEECVDRIIDEFLAGPTGWCIITLHGLDGEGWKPIRSDYLDRLLGRLVCIESLDILPAAAALEKYLG